MKSPAFQFYPDKWQTDTRRLSWEVKGIYHELMCVVWLQFQETCSFPDDDNFMAAEIGCTINEWTTAKFALLNPHRPILEKITDNQGTNRFLVRGLLKEQVKQAERREKLRQNGLKGGRPKNQKVIFEEPKTKPGSENQKLSLPSPSPSLSPNRCTNKQGAGPTLQEVLGQAEFIGMLPADAEQFWNHFESSGWIDKNGHLIQNWKSKQATWKTVSRAMPAEAAHRGQNGSGASAITLGKEYERCIARIKQLKDGCAQDAMGKRFWQPADEVEYETLKKRRDELKKTLGITI